MKGIHQLTYADFSTTIRLLFICCCYYIFWPGSSLLFSIVDMAIANIASKVNLGDLIVKHCIYTHIVKY